MSVSELRNHISIGLANVQQLQAVIVQMENDLQPILRKFVTNKDIPLAERFECWSRHCVKKDMGEITGNSKGSLIERMIEADCPKYFESRGMIFAWDHFILYFEDDEEAKRTGGWCENHLEQFNMTLDDFKEFLIAENFGYFTWDW